MLEKTYEKALLIMFAERGLKAQSQLEVPIVFRGVKIDNAFKLDVLVEDLVIVELKAVEKLLPVHEAQLLTYLKLTKKPKGILINFYCTNIFYEGQKTFVTEEYSRLPKE